MVRGSLGLGGHQASSNFSEGACLKGIRLSVMKDGIRDLLLSSLTHMHHTCMYVCTNHVPALSVQRDPASRTLEGEGRHLKLFSDLYVCTMTSMY